MAHEREVFPVLEDIENSCGEVLHKINEGDSPQNIAMDADKNGILAFSFKDKDGKVVIGQTPNVPVVLGILLIALTWQITEEPLNTILRVMGSLFLLYWAYLEIAQGVNTFRKVLGAVVGIAVIAGLVMLFV